VIGIIDIGGAGLRIYPFMKVMLTYLHKYSVEDIKSQIDLMYKNYKT